VTPPRSRGPSLGTKLAVATVAVLALTSLLVAWGLQASARSALIAAKTKAASLMADVFVASAKAPLDFGDDKDVENVLAHLRANPDISYAALWREGSTTPSAIFGDPGPTRVPDPSSISGSDVRLLADCLEVVRRIARPDGSSLATMVIRFSLAPENAELAAQGRRILIETGGTAAVLALLILGIAQVQIVGPLERLVVASRRLEGGEAVRVDVASGDELGRLATAFNTMSAAVIDREGRLADAMARLRELFDQMRQGIVVFRRGGVVDEAPSRQAMVLFGPDVAGRSIQELLYPGVPEWHAERQALDAWVDGAFDVEASSWGEVAELAPKSVRLRAAGGERWLELQFTPVVRDGSIERVMLLATDVTDQRRLEQEVLTIEAQHARQLGAMRRLVAGGGQVFAAFLETAEARLDRALAGLRAPGAPAATGRGALRDIFQDIHTMRGEARTFDLPELAEECQRIEGLLKELGATEAGPAPVLPDVEAGLAGRIERAQAAVGAARELFVEASPIGRAILDQMTVRRSDVQQLVQTLSKVPDATVRSLVASLSSRPFGECTTSLEASAPRWAVEVGKEVQFAIEGRETRVPGPVAPALVAALPHLVRNAIAHGIEPGTERARRNKPPVGTVRIAAEQPVANRAGAPSVVVRVSDDGAGLDEAAILAEARRRGLPDAAATELVFALGLSTEKQAGELAGQGVGLAAVRSALRGAGCEVALESAPGIGTTVVVTVR
jgi:PAS domain-containing protein/HPt (histidine-containing phosphotransfer) domain-containing protein